MYLTKGSGSCGLPARLLKRRQAQAGVSIFSGVLVMATIGILLATYDSIHQSTSATFATNPQAMSATGAAVAPTSASSQPASTSATSGGACEQTYNKCMADPSMQNSKQICENTWRSCVSKKCVKKDTTTVDSCPKDPDCISSCMELAAADGNIKNCCSVIEHNNACRTKVEGIASCKPQQMKLPDGSTPATGASPTGAAGAMPQLPSIPSGGASPQSSPTGSSNTQLNYIDPNQKLGEVEIGTYKLQSDLNLEISKMADGSAQVKDVTTGQVVGASLSENETAASLAKDLKYIQSLSPADAIASSGVLTGPDGKTYPLETSVSQLPPGQYTYGGVSLNKTESGYYSVGGEGLATLFSQNNQTVGKAIQESQFNAGPLGLREGNFYYKYAESFSESSDIAPNLYGYSGEYNPATGEWSQQPPQPLLPPVEVADPNPWASRLLGYSNAEARLYDPTEMSGPMATYAKLNNGTLDPAVAAQTNGANGGWTGGGFNALRNCDESTPGCISPGGGPAENVPLPRPRAVSVDPAESPQAAPTSAVDPKTYLNQVDEKGNIVACNSFGDCKPVQQAKAVTPAVEPVVKNPTPAACAGSTDPNCFAKAAPPSGPIRGLPEGKSVNTGPPPPDPKPPTNNNNNNGGGGGPPPGSGGGGGGGGNPLGSILSGLAQGLAKAMNTPPATPQQPAQTCSTDPNIYNQQQQQYQQQLQQYNYQLQQYQYQQQMSQYQSQMYGSYATAPVAPLPAQPTPCSPSTQNQCQTQPQQPAASTCTSGFWQPVYSGSCVVNWQCIQNPNATSTAPTASISCAPQLLDVGQTVNITYSCSSGVATSSSFTITGERNGTTTAVIVAPPQNTNTATYTLACKENNQTSGAQCSVQINQPSIVLVANPKTVQPNTTSLIGWVTSGMQSCVVSSPDQPAFTAENAANTSVAGIAESKAIATSATFRLSCQTLGGQAKSATTTVSVL